MPLRKHAYSNILKILSPKTEKIQIKTSWYFSYFCSKHRLWVLVRTASTRRGGSNEYPQSMFLSISMKNYVYPCKTQFYYIKVGIPAFFFYIMLIKSCWWWPTSSFAYAHKLITCPTGIYYLVEREMVKGIHLIHFGPTDNYLDWAKVQVIWSKEHIYFV